MKIASAFVIGATLALTAGGVLAQSPARDQLARGTALWDQRLATSAIAALEAAAKDRRTAAEAHEALGRLFTFKGWLQDNVFPGWHDEPSVRERALAELKASIAADPSRTSAQEALRIAEAFAAADRSIPRRRVRKSARSTRGCRRRAHPDLPLRSSSPPSTPARKRRPIRRRSSRARKC